MPGPPDMENFVDAKHDAIHEGGKMRWYTYRRMRGHR